MRFILTVLLTVCMANTTFPCTIFVLTSGKQVIVGNHEDWTARDARIRFIPGDRDKIGVVVFDFESEGQIQGGVNEAGLFFDGTATPFVAMDFSGKEVFLGKDFWLNLLQHCKTTKEAVAFLEKYQVPDLEQVHILFADRSGKSVIVGAYDGKLTITWKSGQFQTLTNFNIVDPEYGGEQPCPRFAKANEILVKTGIDPRKKAMDVLSQTTQGELTVYSTLLDLTAGTLEVYYLGNFAKSLTFDLKKEWKEEAHDIILAEALKTN